MSDNDKRLAAEAAVTEVCDGMVVGLGTGSTAYHAINAVGAKVAAGLTIRAVATSEASAEQARSLGIPLLDMADVATVDLTIDGADEIDAACRVIKGAGGAMTREKIVATASHRMVVIADGSKRVERLGAAPVPVELLPFARAFGVAQLKALGGESVQRMRGEKAYLTDSGNLVIDTHFASLDNAERLARAIEAIPGVVGHGLFLTEVAAAYIAVDGEVTRLERSTQRD